MRQPLADHLRIRADHLRVLGIGGKRAPQVALPARAAEHLVVGGQQLDVSEGSDSQLNARTSYLVASDELLDNAATLSELCSVRAERSVWPLELHLPHAPGDFLALTLGPWNGEVAQVDHRVALAGHAFVQLDQCLRDVWPRLPQTHQRLDSVLNRAQVLEAQRVSEP